MAGRHFLTVCAVTLGLAAGVFAAGADQGYGAGGTQDKDTHGMTGQTQQPGMSAGMHKFQLDKASNIINKNVRNEKGENLGEIKDLAIDADRHRVAYAVLDFGGFLGIGEKYFAVPFAALNFRPDQKQIVLNVEKDRLKNAPGFDKNNWPDMANQEWGRQVYGYYNQQPYWERELRGEPISPERHMDQPRTPQGQSDMPGRAGEAAGRAGQRMERGLTGRMAGHRNILRAEKQLMKSDVLNDKGEDIGEVADLFVDQHSGHVAFVVLKLDADKIGLDDKENNFAAVPAEVLQISAKEKGERATIKLSNTDKLKGHTFSSDKWPDLSSRQWAESQYRAWGANPYWQQTGRSGEMHRMGTEQRTPGGTSGQ